MTDSTRSLREVLRAVEDVTLVSNGASSVAGEPATSPTKLSARLDQSSAEFLAEVPWYEGPEPLGTLPTEQVLRRLLGGKEADEHG